MWECSGSVVGVIFIYTTSGERDVGRGSGGVFWKCLLSKNQVLSCDGTCGQMSVGVAQAKSEKTLKSTHVWPLF